MKKRLYFITTVLAAVGALGLSSCLKDSRYVNFAQSQPIVNFPLGGLVNFGADAITESPDSLGDIVRQFTIDVASASLPTSATQVTLAIDNSLVAKYDATETAVNYLVLPSNTYSFSTTSATIPAGKRTVTVSVTFHKNLIDQTQSWMLPIKIVSSTNGSIISGNMGIHYFHFIGNDFAGAYEHFYTRWSDGDSTTTASTPRSDIGGITIYPVTPSEFIVKTNYYTQPSYDVTFTKTGTGASATYSNWAVQFLPSDVAAGGQWASNITVIDGPKFRPWPYPNFDPNASYTYAQALKLFRFYFQTSSRAIIDEYVKQ